MYKEHIFNVFSYNVTWYCHLIDIIIIIVIIYYYMNHTIIHNLFGCNITRCSYYSEIFSRFLYCLGIVSLTNKP